MCITFSQDQLNDAIESKKDVTKTGMTGFYSNLLTKNIATGADAEVHATSAYTAGGKRIDNALAIDRDKGRSTRDTSDRSDKSDDTVKRSEKRDRHGNDDSEVGVKREKHDHNSDSFPTKETGSNNSAYSVKYGTLRNARGGLNVHKGLSAIDRQNTILALEELERCKQDYFLSFCPAD